MHRSALTPVIFLFLAAFLHVHGGKVPQKTEDVAKTPAVNEMVKATEEEVKVSAPEKVAGETLEDDTSATFSITVSSDPGKDLSAIPTPRPGWNYMSQLQSFMSQFLSFLGLRAHVERKHRGLEFESENEIQMGSVRDGLKTTLGAVIGKGECYQKVTCRAGKYLKTIKAKELIIIILEKVTPAKWIETVKMLRESAIHGDKCEYKCLD